MIGALVLIWVGFQIVGAWLTGEGVFLTPRNLWNLLVQTSAIAVMSTGMVLIIVMRHIDLSVGSMLSFIGVVTGVAQAYWLSPLLGFDHPVDLDRRASSSRSRSARRSAPSTASSSPMPASPPSSSRSAASSSTTARRGG